MRILARSAALSFLLSVVIWLLGTGGLLFWALGRRQRLDVLGAYVVSVWPDGSFDVQFGAGYLLGFLLLVLLLTVALALMANPAARPRDRVGR